MVTTEVEEPFAINDVGLADIVDPLAEVDAALTLTLNRSFPVALILPSVAAMKAVSAVYSAIIAVATPFVKVMLVADPIDIVAMVG
jgi:hypothetical protein